MQILEITILRSIIILNANTGIVYFVGMAARLVTSAIPMAINASINNVKLVPPKNTAIKVRC